MSHEELVLLEARLDDFPDFEIRGETAREYKEGEIFSHIIGYTSKIKPEEFESKPELYSLNDYVGREGVENYYEKYLRKIREK